MRERNDGTQKKSTKFSKRLTESHTVNEGETIIESNACSALVVSIPFHFISDSMELCKISDSGIRIRYEIQRNSV